VQNAWGLTRILGELRKLNIKSVSRNTVKNILKANGLDPGPQRGVGTWDEFLKLHAATLWQCDFLSVRTLTTKGIRELYLLVFLHVESRRVFVTPATYHPNEAWVCDQVMAFAAHAQETGLGAEVVMHDRDAKFMMRFDETLRNTGLRVQKAAYRSPNTVAFVERFNQTLRQELLDHFIIFGELHLNHLVSVFVDYYHRLRPHQGKDNEPLVPARVAKRRPGRKQHIPPPSGIALAEIRCEKRLGGLLKHYYRKAA
jgi:putative transposase